MVNHSGLSLFPAHRSYPKSAAEAEPSVCHCSVSSAAGLGDASANALLTEQWHTAAPIAIIPGYTRRLDRLVTCHATATR